MLINQAKKIIRRTPLWDVYLNSKDLSKSFQLAFRKNEDLKDLKTYVMFIGYERSGHSLIGEFLDAHPDVVIAHEMDVLRLSKLGVGRDHLFKMILEHSKGFDENGKLWGYSNKSVPGQWNGKYRKLKVIGDKQGGKSTLRLANDQKLLEKTQKKMKGMNFKVIHYIRHPFDTIVARAKQYHKVDELSQKLLSEEVDKFIMKLKTTQDLRRVYGDSVELINMKHEDFVADPVKQLATLCEFIGVEPEPNYLKACADIVFDSPRQRRHEVDWSEDLIKKVESQVKKDQHSNDYRFED